MLPQTMTSGKATCAAAHLRLHELGDAIEDGQEDEAVGDQHRRDHQRRLCEQGAGVSIRCGQETV